MIELNREKIIKGLECCHDLSCNKCPYTSVEWCAKQRITDALALIKELIEENERLESELGKEFTCFVGDPHKVERCPYLEEMERIKAGTVRKMQERLKQNVTLVYRQSDYVTTEDIDQVAKEILEEENDG